MNNLKKYREMRRLSIRELARLANVPPSNISMCESGKRRMTRELSLSLSEVLKVDADELMGDDDWIIRVAVKPAADNYDTNPVDLDNKFKELLDQFLSRIQPYFVYETKEDKTGKLVYIISSIKDMDDIYLDKVYNYIKHLNAIIDFDVEVKR